MSDKKEHTKHKKTQHKSHSHGKKEHKKHEKKEHKEHKAHKKQHKSHKKEEKQNPWAYATAVFGILFIAALLTNGFTGTSTMDHCINSVNKLSEKHPETAELSDIAVQSMGAIQEKIEEKESEPEETSGSGSGSEEVKLDFYVMSQCPYGTEVVDAIAPVMDKLGSHIDFNLEYIADKDGDGFKSLHGQSEVKGNIVQLCAMEYNPDKYMDMITCQNENADNIPGNWEKCAEEADLKVDKIRQCYEGEEGKELLRESLEKAKEAGATGSPTIFLNDESYSGGRSTTDFMRAICENIEGTPKACEELPEVKEINLKVLTDERCEECSGMIKQLTSNLGSLFPEMNVEKIDYNTEEGKNLYDEIGGKRLPAFLFEEEVKDTSKYSQVKNYISEAGDYLHLAVGSKFDPTKEICDNDKDDTGNGKVDCEDPDCQGKTVCREEKEKHLQLFTMSDCPYGKEAIISLDEVVENLEDIDYEVHYIASKTEDGFSSLHGQYEVEENIRQLCVKEHSSDAWRDYLVCRSENGVKDKDWQNCAEKTGVDKDAVKECTEGEEGEELLSEDIKIAKELGISASPTWLANNKYKFSGVDAEKAKTELCKRNEGLEGCSKTLSSSNSGSSTPSGTC
ncbi:MAG: DsbA family protein [Nanobdellota archaeon]